MNSVVVLMYDGRLSMGDGTRVELPAMKAPEVEKCEMNDIQSKTTKGRSGSDATSVTEAVLEWSSGAQLPSRDGDGSPAGALKGMAADRFIHDPVGLLIRQSGREPLLTRTEELEVARTLVSSRREFLEQLLSCPPIARKAIELIREVLLSGSYCYHRNILEFGGSDEKREILATVTKATVNVETASAILDRCESEWIKVTGARRLSASNPKAMEAMRADRAKVGRLLAEIPMRAGFIRGFHAELETLVSQVRSGARASIAARTQLSTTQDTEDGLIATWERLSKAYTVYMDAKDVLVRRNLPLAVYEAKRFRIGSLSLEDLTQEGVMGLMIAAEKFEPERGLRFCTYATPWIRQCLYRFADNHSRTVRVPGIVQNAIRKVEEYRQYARGYVGREPTPEEIERALKGKTGAQTVTAAWLDTVAPAAEPELSISRPLPARGRVRRTIADTLEDSRECSAEVAFQRVIAEHLTIDLATAMAANLDERQRLVLEHRFGLNGKAEKTLRELGDELGLTRERVRQIEEKALKKLELALARQYGS